MRKARVIKPASIKPDINVTPLIDVVLVLLIIFMVITPLLHNDIAIQIPNNETVQTEADVPPDQLIIRLGADGSILLNEKKLEMKDIRVQLGAKLKKQRSSARVVFITADKKANYQRYIQILAEARNAGAKTLGVATKAADEEPVATQTPQ